MIRVTAGSHSRSQKELWLQVYNSSITELTRTAAERSDHFASSIADMLLSVSGYEISPGVPWTVNLSDLSKFSESTQAQLNTLINGALRGLKPADALDNGSEKMDQIRERWLTT